MDVITRRFGTISVSESEFIRFPRKLVGFPNDDQFVLLRHKPNSSIGWLQSISSPGLALPVVSLEAIETDIQEDALLAAVQHAKIADRVAQCAVLVVLTALPNFPATVNLLAPIIVNVQTRTGAQLLLEGTPYSTREPFVLRTAAPLVPPSVYEPQMREGLEAV